MPHKPVAYIPPSHKLPDPGTCLRATRLRIRRAAPRIIHRILHNPGPNRIQLNIHRHHSQRRPTAPITQRINQYTPKPLIPQRSLPLLMIRIILIVAQVIALFSRISCCFQPKERLDKLGVLLDIGHNCVQAVSHCFFAVDKQLAQTCFCMIPNLLIRIKFRCICWKIFLK